MHYLCTYGGTGKGKCVQVCRHQGWPEGREQCKRVKSTRNHNIWLHDLSGSLQGD